jgi:hypothetical protein
MNIIEFPDFLDKNCDELVVEKLVYAFGSL